MPEYICLFCRKTKSDKSVEHVIPDSLLSSSGSGFTLSWRVCGKCNNGFGESIDSEFINSSHINYLRQMHHEYLPETERGKLILRDANKTMLIDSDGFVFPAYRMIYRSSVDFIPVESPIAIPGTGERYFIRELSRAGELYRNLLNKNRRIISSQLMLNYSPYNPKTLQTLRYSVIFPRFISKIALEYLCIKYDLVSYDTLYSPLSDFAYGRISSLPKTYLMRISDMDINHLNPHYNFSRHDRHTIGIHSNGIEKYFYFSVFNVTTFYLTLPEDPRVTTQSDEVLLKRVSGATLNRQFIGRPLVRVLSS